jgi:hypothetical protein
VWRLPREYLSCYNWKSAAFAGKEIGSKHKVLDTNADPERRPAWLTIGAAAGIQKAKFVMRLEIVKDFSRIAEGKGGYWEDYGYGWYAGI